MKRMTTTTKIRTTIRRTPVQRASAAAQLPRPRPRRLARPRRPRERESKGRRTPPRAARKARASRSSGLNRRSCHGQAVLVAGADPRGRRLRRGARPGSARPTLQQNAGWSLRPGQRSDRRLTQRSGEHQAIRKSVKKLRERPGFKNPSPPPTARTGNIRSQRPKQKQTTQARSSRKKKSKSTRADPNMTAWLTLRWMMPPTQSIKRVLSKEKDAEETKKVR